MIVTSRRAPEQVAVARRDALRGNCMGAAMLLILQVALGMGVNLYVTIPAGKAFFTAIFGSALLAAHVGVALLLLGASISALVRSVKTRTAVPFTVVGLLAIVAAAVAGASFVSTGADGASLSMALGAAVAMTSYVVAVFRVR